MRILSQLLDNCRKSNRQIGKELGVSGGTIMSRIKRMKESQVIEKFAIKVQPAVLGHHLLYIVIKDIDVNEIFERIKFVGTLDFVVPCIGGITVCSIVIKDDLQEKTKLLNELIKDVKILSTFKAKDSGFKHKLTKTDLEIIGELIKDPRQKKEIIAKQAKMSTKTIARCIEKLHESNEIQFSLICNPVKMSKFIPHAIVIWINEQKEETLRDLNRTFEESYLETPLITKDQIILFMYTDSIFKIDDSIQEIKARESIKSIELFIPKEFLFPNKWLKNIIADYKKSSKLHLTYPRN